MNEKQALEQGAIENFITAYTEDAEGVLQFVKLLEPPFPDGMCTLNGNNIYIEVGHIYDTTADTKHLLVRTDKQAPTEQDKQDSRLIPLNKRLIISLNRLLEKKSYKKYKGSPVWLLIRSATPLWSKSNFQDHLNEILVPGTHSFDQIWLLCGPRSDFGILKLF